MSPVADTARVWRLAAGRSLPLGGRTLVVGILNVTPDSFADGGRYLAPDAAARRADEIAAEGADVIDVGGESTRPGASPVDCAEEIRRVLPAVRAAVRTGLPVSIDTSKADVAAAALEAGASIVNDVTALGDPRMAGVVAQSGAGVILMHMKGTPRTMQDDPRYEDVVGEVAAFLADRADRARAAGILDDRIAVDPGIGFGKRLEDNLDLLANLGGIAHGRPVVVGASRKSFIGALGAGESPADRLEGSLAAAVAAALAGAAAVRVHDVAATRRALAVADAIRGRAP